MSENEQTTNAKPDLTELLGKRGFIVNDGKTTTVTLIGDAGDEKVPDAVEVISEQGKVVCKLSEIVFEGPVEELPPQLPAAPEPPKPSGMTLRDTATSSILDPNTYLQLKSISKDFFESNAVPKVYQNTMQVLFGLQAGYEMGMQPVESLQSLTIINGLISPWGKAVVKLLRKHGWDISYEEGGTGDDQFCQVTITRGDETYTDKVTFGEVRQSGYTTDNNGKLKIGWKEGLNRKLKLRYDTIDVLIKTYVPEVYGSTAGMAEVLEDGDFSGDQPEDIKTRARRAANGVKVDRTAAPKPYIDGETSEPGTGGDGGGSVQS